jgi:hypothetical protein
MGDDDVIRWNERRWLTAVGVCVLAILITCTSTGLAGNVRPEADKGPTIVNVRIFIIDVDEIGTADQDFSANVFYEARWKDPRLAHDSAGTIVRPLTEVWNPQLMIINRERIWKSIPDVAVIASDGSVLYRQRVWGQFSQGLRLEDFPFDEHVFGIDIAATGFRSNEVSLVEDPDLISGVAGDVTLADFRVTGSKMRVAPYEPIPGGPSVPAIRFEFAASREYGYYIAKVLLPLVLIVAMSWIVFWIDPKQSGTQISLGVTTMLTLIAYRFSLTSILPKIAYLTRMDAFVLGSTFLVFATLVEVVVTSHLALTDRLERARAIDKWMRIVFPALFVVLAVKTLIS